MPKLSAGILLYHFKNAQLEIFLVHPGGPFWAKKDAGAWSLPKGEYAESDDPLQAAKREFGEETSQHPPAGEFVGLGEVKYSNKLLSAWAIEGDIDARAIRSNMFTLEWPPKSGKMQEFPEVDKTGWFDATTAKTKLVSGQTPFVDRLIEKLGVELPKPLAEPEQISLL